MLSTLQRLCGGPQSPAPTEYTLGISSAMRRIEATLPQLARTDSSVLITGESGVGKEEVARALLDRPWPGNVRELKHCLERACVLFPDGPLTAKALFGEIQPAVLADEDGPAGNLGNYLEAREREFIEKALYEHSGRIADTAATLGISRKNLWEKMRKLGIQEKASLPTGK